MLQERTRPAVYLDHWAVRRIASNPDLASRFAAALKARQGTWAISTLNLIEFIQMTDATAAKQFEALLELALPNLFFIEFQVFQVMELEKVALRGSLPFAPYSDNATLLAFAETRPDTPRPFTAKGLVSVLVERRDELLPGLARMQETGVERITAMREELRGDKDLEKRVSGSQSAARMQPTWLLVRELMRAMLLDKDDRPVQKNDVMDLFHAAVPVAYCDVVLLDGKWADRVGQVRKRVRREELGVELAEVLSERRDGLERFLSWLESGDQCPSPMGTRSCLTPLELIERLAALILFSTHEVLAPNSRYPTAGFRP